MKRKDKQLLGNYLRCLYKLHYFSELLEMVTKVLKAAEQVVKNRIPRNKETNKKQVITFGYKLLNKTRLLMKSRFCINF